MTRNGDQQSNSLDYDGEIENEKDDDTSCSRRLVEKQRPIVASVCATDRTRGPTTLKRKSPSCPLASQQRPRDKITRMEISKDDIPPERISLTETLVETPVGTTNRRQSKRRSEIEVGIRALAAGERGTRKRPEPYQ